MKYNSEIHIISCVKAYLCDPVYIVSDGIRSERTCHGVYYPRDAPTKSPTFGPR